MTNHPPHLMTWDENIYTLINIKFEKEKKDGLKKTGNCIFFILSLNMFQQFVLAIEKAIDSQPAQ